MNDRYSRQQLFAPIGIEGQEKLANKHVFIIGAGALGTGNAEALARAGVGRITIADRDYVEWSNLGRQQLYTEADARERIPKAIAAERRLKQINTEIDVRGIVADVSIDEIHALVKHDVDLIIDGTDNFDTRLLINDVSQKYCIPWIYGACVGSYGLTYTIMPGDKPCLNCLLSSVPIGGPTCDTAGIIAPAVGMVVAYQVTEALKILVEDWASLRDTLVTFDLWKNQMQSIKVGRMKKTDCPSCGTNPVHPYLMPSNQARTAVLCGRETVQIRPSSAGARNLEALAGALEKQQIHTELNPYLLSFKVDDYRLVVFKDGRMLVHGTKDIAQAKNFYYRFLG